MSERLEFCPRCKILHPKIIKVHNPETGDMNSNATLECEICFLRWEGQITSKYMQEQIERGW